MKKVICSKCNLEVSNKFGVKLEFCTNCGSPLGKYSESVTVVNPIFDQDLSLMPKKNNSNFLFGCLGTGFAFLLLSSLTFLGVWWITSNTTISHPEYYGKIVVPKTQTVRFVGSYSSNPTSLDPQLITNGNTIISALFDGLVEFKGQDEELKPSLAEKWEINDDATVWTFYLRKDAKWTNGETITAEDFVFSWKRVLDPKLGIRSAFLLYSIKNAEKFNLNQAKEKDLGIKAIDKSTLQVTLESPMPFFDKVLCDFAFKPIPKTVVEKYGENWAKPENIVTSGAFKLTEWTENEQITLQRNSLFWDNTNTKLNTIIFPQDPREKAGNTKEFLPTKLYFENHIDAISREIYIDSEYMKSKDFQRYKTLQTTFLSINTNIKPLDDGRVRKALNLAIDREKLKEINRINFPASSFVPGIKNFETSKKIKFDADKARKLLAEAGFPNGNGFPDIEYAFNESALNRSVAENLVEQWQKELGVKIKINNMNWKDFLKYRSDLRYKGLARNGWFADYADPYNFLEIFTGVNDRTSWNNNEYVNLFNKSKSEVNEANRFKILAEAEDLLLENNYIIPLYNPSVPFLSKPYVKNLLPNTQNYINWREVYIDTNLTEGSLTQDK